MFRALNPPGPSQSSERTSSLIFHFSENPQFLYCFWNLKCVVPIYVLLHVSVPPINLKSPPPGPYIQLETNFCPVESSWQNYVTRGICRIKDGPAWAWQSAAILSETLGSLQFQHFQRKKYMWRLWFTKSQIGLCHQISKADMDHEIHYAVITGIRRVTQ